MQNLSKLKADGLQEQKTAQGDTTMYMNIVADHAHPF